MICDAWSVVVVPFPFTDSAQSKSRPAVVLSTRAFNRDGQTTMAMVTDARHTKRGGDIPLPAGTAHLATGSLIRMKIFSLDNRLIQRKLGMLPSSYGKLLAAQLQTVLKLKA